MLRSAQVNPLACRYRHDHPPATSFVSITNSWQHGAAQRVPCLSMEGSRCALGSAGRCSPEPASSAAFLVARTHTGCQGLTCNSAAVACQTWTVSAVTELMHDVRVHLDLVLGSLGEAGEVLGHGRVRGHAPCTRTLRIPVPPKLIQPPVTTTGRFTPAP